jgi:hypothetical protein
VDFYPNNSVSALGYWGRRFDLCTNGCGVVYSLDAQVESAD